MASPGWLASMMHVPVELKWTGTDVTKVVPSYDGVSKIAQTDEDDGSMVRVTSSPEVESALTV